ncbi:MAG: T9SS type A sorting domain-containing protein [Crocinitomicaceae bacterium]|nr:T9SS type A sorting domain-containing protein [Crocinitomicaceae bacterium]
MNKNILTLSMFSLLTFATVKAQSSGIEIQLDGTGSNLAGTVHSVSLNSNSPEIAGNTPFEIHFDVTNNTGQDQQLRITRKKINVPTTWVDQLCWPPSCFPTGSGLSYITPNTAGNPAPIIVNGTHLTTNGETAELKPRITIDQSTATSALYRFYVTTTTGAFLDSIDLSINFTLGIQSIKQAPVITLAPNPASENITVSTGIIDNATVQIMDVLGNIVYKDVITNGSKQIDVSDFKNGVYFVVIDPVGMKPTNRKLIIKH